MSSGPFDDPLKDWPNDDVLLTENARKHLTMQAPTVAPVLIWPELAKLFEQNDEIAKGQKQRRLARGLLAVGLSLLGLAVAIWSPIIIGLDGIESVFSDEAETFLGLLAAGATFAGGLLGISQVLWGRSKVQWLERRFVTERMRQFYFQFIINNLEAAAKAMNGGADLAAWNDLREKALAEFRKQIFDDAPAAYIEVLKDKGDAKTWYEDKWRARPTTFAAGVAPLAQELFGVLKKQRIGIQKRHSSAKTHATFYSPVFRALWLDRFSDLLTFAVLVVAVMTGIWMFTDGITEDVKLWLAISATLSAVIVALRVVDDGMQLNPEAERYEWYSAACSALWDRFGDAESVSDKMEILRDQERLSYQEMRRFLQSHHKARFLL